LSINSRSFYRSAEVGKLPSIGSNVNVNKAENIEFITQKTYKDLHGSVIFHQKTLILKNLHVFKAFFLILLYGSNPDTPPGNFHSAG